eukprot:scaffold5064_cov121-Cylindrotheca_fusiformis.AAC.17
MPSNSTTKSPFFRPTEKPDFTQTPGGTQHQRKKAKGEDEHKSTIAGCSANVINAIVGAGIVGLPYAVMKAGFVSGVALILFCGIMTDKSLRLLIETAKHAHVPSYETVAEAAFGRPGFLFVAINMFVMSYGAMLSYLMIVKDTFSAVLGIHPDDLPMKRALLFLISITIIVPLSSQRVRIYILQEETPLRCLNHESNFRLRAFVFLMQDMADLAATSRMNVMFDITMVMLVLYCAPIKESLETFEWKENLIHYDTLFVGLGVLSFAFVCQHSAFIIAGSLHNPTKNRWARVTKISLAFCSTLALLCGVGGFLGYQDSTDGNVLNSMDDSIPANIARTLLGTTMLFVYPMESFVSRHVCVVLFFQGRKAHEGDDTSVLNRRDRRITLTFLLYLSAVLPAALFKDVGLVLAASGAIGGSCLSYIGPGAVYLGVHGARFLEISKYYFGLPRESSESPHDELEPLYSKPVAANLDHPAQESWITRKVKDAAFYILLMPIWCKIAQIGTTYLTSHVTDLALKSPHPIRIGNVRFAPAQLRGGNTRVVILPPKGSTEDHSSSDVPITTTLIRSDSLPRGHGALRAPDGQIVALPQTATQGDQLLPQTNTNSSKGYQSINDQVGAMAARRAKEERLALEDDPQHIPPGVCDFVIAVFYIMFGILAMVAGLISIFEEQ